ncbi:MAG: DNA primase [Pseudomonadota bacterium]
MPGRIPQSFINDLLDRVDIVDVVDARVKLKKTGKNYSGLCPFHDEKTPSFTVSPDKQFFHCFGCQESGTALTFIMQYERLEFVEAVELLARQLGLEVPREKGGRERPQVDPDLYAVLGQAEQYYRRSLRQSDEAIAYLKSRGMSGEIARDFGIGYAPEGWQNLSENLGPVKTEQLLDTGLSIKNEKGRVYDRFRQRIMFPIRDTRGRVIGFGGRAMAKDEQGPKYLNSPETQVFHKSQELYGLYEARRALRHIDRLIVVEGYMDVVALAQHGFANAVATLGTATGEAHFHKLYRITDEVICCFDGDQAGRQAAWRALDAALPTLNEHRQLKFVFLPDGEDPDSLVRQKGQDAFQQFLDNASPGLELLFARQAEGLDLQTLDGQAKLAGLLNPYISKVPDGLLKDLLLQRLADLTGAGRQRRRVAPMATQKPSDELPDKRLGKVSQRLLTLLLKEPVWWFELTEAQRAGLLESKDRLGMLGELIAYIDSNDQVDTEELLVRWSDHPDYPWLLQRAQQSSEIDRAAQQAGFVEGMGRLLDMLTRIARQQQLSNLKESQNVEELRKYWQMRDT